MSSEEILKLKLYIAGGAPNSVRAQVNLQAALKGRAPGQYALEIVDMLEQPLQALTDGILVTPTLVKLAPAPMLKIIGDLSDREKLQAALGLMDRRQ